MPRLRGNGRNNNTLNIEETPTDDHTKRLFLAAPMEKFYK